MTTLTHIVNFTRAHLPRARTIQLWGVFFLIIYLIALLKITTWENLQTHALYTVYSILITVYIFSRFLLAYFHTSPSVISSYTPSVTFVIPAKNEEDAIAHTIRACGESDYPREKMEIIAINDGSTDGTLEQMRHAQRELEGIVPVTVVHWDTNRGKREGMAEGVMRAKNDIIVFIDSDSFIRTDCVRHLVKYFSNPRVGAVSGHTDVYNRDTNLLTRMQAVRYYIAFKIYKAAESIFGMVTCCPGCCSAYRRSYLLEYLDVWLNQTLFGAKCTFGDDRSLTNFIIRKYQAVYAPEAIAHTVVPDTFKTYVRQQQRWKKSWIRETCIAASFIWKKNAIAAISFYTYLFLALFAPVVFFRAVFWYPIMHHTAPFVYLLGLFLMLFLHGLYYRAKVGPRAWFLAVISFWFHTVILIWQLPWAFLTISDSRWGTR